MRTGTRGLQPPASQQGRQAGRQPGTGSRRRSYIKRGLKWEEEGGHKGSREEGSGGNGRGSERWSVHDMNERTMFGHGGFALPVCCSILLLHLPGLPPSCGWSVKVTRLPESRCLVSGVGSFSPTAVGSYFLGGENCREVGGGDRVELLEFALKSVT